MDPGLTPQRVIAELQHDHLDVDMNRATWNRVEAETPMRSLIGALRITDNLDTRRALLDLLGFRNARSAIPDIIAHLDHPDSDIRASAADALGKAFGYLDRPPPPDRVHDGLAALLRRWELEPHDGIRATLAQTMALVGDPSVQPLLTAALRDPEPMVRGQAHWGLGYLDGLEREGYSRRRFAWAHTPYPGWHPDDPEEVITYHGDGIDPSLTAQRVIEELERDDLSERASEAMWRRIWDRAPVRSLIGAARVATESDTRRAVLDLLGYRTARSAIPEFITHIDDPDAEVRAAAAEALGKVLGYPDTPARPGLVAAALAALRRRWEAEPDDGIRATLAETLAMVGDPSVRPLLIAAHQHRDEAVREQASWGLRYLAVLEREGLSRRRFDLAEKPPGDWLDPAPTSHNGHHPE